MEKCKKHLQANPATDLVAGLEEILDSEYRRNVLTHPDYLNLDYQFLIAIWSPGKRVELYSTTRTALRRISNFECIGIGAELAAYLIRPGFSAPSLKNALGLATYVLASVKEAVTGCGGMSLYSLFRNDGQIGILTSMHDGPTKDVEDYAKQYDFTMRRLLMWMADPEMEDAHFEQNLTEMVNEIIQKRRNWSRMRRDREREFAESNPELKPSQVKTMFSDIAMGFLPAPDPKDML